MAANESFLEFDDLDSSTIGAYIKLQAIIRGFLVRKALQEIQQEYENIVTDFDEGLDVIWPQAFGIPELRKPIKSLKTVEQAGKNFHTKERLIRQDGKNLHFSRLSQTDSQGWNSVSKLNPSFQQYYHPDIPHIGGIDPPSCERNMNDTSNQTQEVLTASKNKSCVSSNDNDMYLSKVTANESKNNLEGNAAHNVVERRHDGDKGKAAHNGVERRHDGDSGLNRCGSSSVSNQCIQTDLDLTQFNEPEKVMPNDFVCEVNLTTDSLGRDVEGNGSTTRKSSVCQVNSYNLNVKEREDSGVFPLLCDVQTSFEEDVVKDNKSSKAVDGNSDHSSSSHIDRSFSDHSDIVVAKPFEISNACTDISMKPSGEIPSLVDAAVSPIKSISPLDPNDNGQSPPTLNNSDGNNVPDMETTSKNDSQFDPVPCMETLTQVILCQASDLPNDKESLLELKKTMMMELLWIQQAINSRTHYLRLKHQLM